MIRTFKRFVLSLAIIGSLSGLVAIAQPATSTYATGPTCGDTLLTFPAWYKGLTKPGTNCELKDIASKVTDPNTQIGIEGYVTRIVMNVIEIILQLVGYAALVMLIVGGYQYITSAGDSNLMTSAKKTITNSLVGLIISIFSVATVTLVSSIFTATSTTSKIGGTNVNIQQVGADQSALAAILNAAYIWAAIVAVLVIVIAGFFFVTSRGDAQMVQRARKGILGAVVGLIVVLMAYIITQFVLGSVG